MIEEVTARCTECSWGMTGKKRIVRRAAQSHAKAKHHAVMLTHQTKEELRNAKETKATDPGDTSGEGSQ
jgi:hypothetical protein